MTPSSATNQQSEAPMTPARSSPERTPEASRRLPPSEAQRMTALKHAQEIRQARGRSRMAIRPLPTAEGKAQLARLIVIYPHWLSSEPIHLLLMWPRRMQARTVRHLMAMIDAHGVRPLGSLTERQRKALADELSKPIAERSRENLSRDQRQLADKSRAVDGSAGEGE